MASASGSISNDLGPFDRLIQQRRDTAAAREKEDRERAQIQQKSNKEFEQSQALRVALLKSKQASRLEKERSDQLAALNQIKARHEIELDNLRRRDEKQIVIQQGETEKKLSEIHKSTNALVDELRRGLGAEARNQSDARNREEEELQHKRAREDNRLKDELLAAVDEEARRPARDSMPTVHTKRTRSSESSVPEETIESVPEETDQRVLRSSKKQKLNNPQPPVQPMTTASAPTSKPAALPVIVSREVDDLENEPPTGVLSKLPEYSANGDGGNAIKTCFELKYISAGKGREKAIWRESPGRPNKTLWANPTDRTFEPYDAEFCETII
jgi:hypothetical protein